MFSRKRSQKGRAAQASAQSLFESAFFNPAGDERGRKFDPAADRKTLQLCRQVQRELMLSLGDGGDDVLGSLGVEAVQPLGGAGHLLVRLSLPAHVSATLAEVNERLEASAGRLRSLVAQAICRKRAPALTFVVAPPPAPQGGGQ